MEGDMNKPWYKSLKTWLGITFAGAVLVGGILDIKTRPDNVVRILELWAIMSGTYLGIRTIGKVSHKVVKKAGAE